MDGEFGSNFYGALERKAAVTDAQNLIAETPSLVAELRLLASTGGLLSSEACCRVADTLDKFVEFEGIVRAGRHAFSGMNPAGATILDFFNVWLDQAKRDNESLRNRIAFAQELMTRAE